MALVWALACGSGPKKPDGSGGSGGMAGTGGAGGSYLQALLPEDYAAEDFRRELQLPIDARISLRTGFEWKPSAARPFPVDLDVLEGSDERGRSLIQIFADDSVPHARVGLALVKLEANVRYQLELELAPAATRAKSNVDIVVRRARDGHVVARGREALAADAAGDVHLAFATPVTTIPRLKLESVVIVDDGSH